jgi:hypothetical protein
MFDNLTLWEAYELHATLGSAGRKLHNEWQKIINDGGSAFSIWTKLGAENGELMDEVFCRIFDLSSDESRKILGPRPSNKSYSFFTTTS